METKALVRQHLELIPEVTRTWFEFDLDEIGEGWLKTLVVEVEFDTDPNSPSHKPNVLDNIRLTTLENQTTMVVSGLRVVPKRV
jgi:hypothetical protein